MGPLHYQYDRWLKLHQASRTADESLTTRTIDPSGITEEEDRSSFRVAGGLLDLQEPGGLVDHRISRMTDETLDLQNSLSCLTQSVPRNEDLKTFVSHVDQQVLCCRCPWFCNLLLSL